VCSSDLDEDYVEINQVTVVQFIKKWFENEYIMGVEDTTYYNANLLMKNHIKPRFEKLKLQNLNADRCQEFISSMYKEGYSYSTIDGVSNLIKKALDSAVSKKYIKSNYMRTVSMPKKKQKEMIVWTSEQVNQFLHATKHRRFYCAYALALLAGMRQGEILGLRWKDIDFEKKTVTVNQTLTHYGKSIKSGAKTASGVRTISVSAQLIEVLKKQRRDYLELKLCLGEAFEDMDIVMFNLRNGKTIFPANLTKTYKKDVKDSGLPHISFHSLRHTHATMLISKNVHAKIISSRLGHSKIGVTLDIYSHVLPAMQQEAVDKLDEMILL
jgi:integrase